MIELRQITADLNPNNTIKIKIIIPKEVVVENNHTLVLFLWI